MRPALLAFAVATTVLRADSLASLKEALRRLPGTSALKGTLEIKTSNQGGKGKDAVNQQGSGSVWVEEGPLGLRLQWSKSFLQQLQEEAARSEREPGAKTPLTSALSEAHAGATLRHTQAAPSLLLLLDRARLLEERAEPWNGQPARLLTLELAPKAMKEEDRKKLKAWESRLLVWVDAGGLPLASRTTTRSKTSAMMMSVESRNEVAATYARSGDRLVITWRERKDTQTLPLVGEVLSQTVATFRIQ